MRGVGVADALAGVVPPALVPVIVLLTQFGDAWFVMVAATGVHWLGPRYGVVSERNAARFVAVAVTAFGVVVAAKALFALPRPPASVALVAADGYGFPSGHATAAAALYGAAAFLFARPRRRVRYALAATFLVLVAGTRLLLGVHYLADVLAGALVGSLVVAAVLAVTRRRLTDGFALAAFAGLAAVAVAGPTTDALAAMGLAVGALCGSVLAGRRERLVVRAPRALAGYVVFGGLAIAALHAPLPAYGVAITSGVAGVGVLVVPTVRVR